MKSKKILITGGTNGIGKALAKVFLAHQHRVWIAGRSAEKLQSTVKELNGEGRLGTLLLDLTDIDRIIPTLAGFDEQTGGMDVVIANAGVGQVQLFEDFNWETLRETHFVNALGAMATLAAFFEPMRKRRAGHWVAISSLNADIAVPGSTAYGSSKAAISHFCEAARAECEAYGIALTLIHPGYVRTNMTAKNFFPMPFIIDGDQAAEKIYRAIIARKRFFSFPWPFAFFIWVSNFIPSHLRGRITLKTLAKSKATAGITTPV